MALNDDEAYEVQRERLRALLTQLETVPAGDRHDELLQRAHILIADIWRTQAVLDAARRGLASTSRLNDDATVW